MNKTESKPAAEKKVRKIHDFTVIILALFPCVLSYAFMFATYTTPEATYSSSISSCWLPVVSILLLVLRIKRMRSPYLAISGFIIIISIIAIILSFTQVLEGFREGYISF
jgi:hypothetical protein